MEKIHIEILGEYLRECPNWWQSYVSSIWTDKMPKDDEFDKRLYDDWKIEASDGVITPMIIIFPSKEIYTQFMLTYG